MPHSEPKPRPHQGILRQESDGRHDAEESVCPRSYLGMNSNQSPRPTPKSVSIVQEPEVISPLILGAQKQVDSECDLEPRPSPRRLSIKGPLSKRLSGRLGITSSPSFGAPFSNTLESSDADEDGVPRSRQASNHHHLEDLIDQVSQWIKEERSKRADKRPNGSATDGSMDRKGASDENQLPLTRQESNRSEDSLDLDKLESIIKNNLSLERKSRRSRNRSPSYQRRKSSLAKLKSSASSDTEAAGYESEVYVPSCDAVLDNSQTLAYTGGAASDSDTSSDELERTTSYKDLDAWAKFKFEIVRLTHTLRLKGWRRVPMEMSNEIAVERLSGALTNAVYVVTPPTDLPPQEGESGLVQPKKPPPKLLLRVYGAQVDHLIDREAELAILRRLAKKKIGPCLLGTFANGRFEEYLYAKPLTPDDLRNSDTSRQIAKRMRELHDGIELLDQERDDGAFVWRNWDKWVRRVEQIVGWLDCQIMQLEPGVKPTGAEAWKRRGFICGGPWRTFRATVERYREWLEAQYGGRKEIRERLVFSHNDTQYGNILRLMPTGDSPLLLPANTHKQLIVIDFEYANANLPGLEFANHFTEWCYNYHDPRKPYAFHQTWYPKPEEQDRFIRAYVRHRPQFNVNTPTLGPTTPSSEAPPPGEGLIRRPTSSISNFMLDARTPSTTSVTQQNSEEAVHKEEEDQEVARLLHETRLWRLANTAQWVAWGIVQAKVPGMPNFNTRDQNRGGEKADVDNDGEEDGGERSDIYKDFSAQQPDAGEGDGEEEMQEVEEEFDYLAYAQHRALFFWADAIQLGFAKEEDLPEEMRGKIKTVAC